MAYRIKYGDGRECDRDFKSLWDAMGVLETDWPACILGDGWEEESPGLEKRLVWPDEESAATGIDAVCAVILHAPSRKEEFDGWMRESFEAQRATSISFWALLGLVALFFGWLERCFGLH